MPLFKCCGSQTCFFLNKEKIIFLKQSFSTHDGQYNQNAP